MTKHETRLTRREAERLLDAPTTHDNALGWALSAARAPAHPSELRHEDAEVAAFHSARLSPPPAGRRAFVSPTRLCSRAAVHAVVATGAVVALASGGFALAGSIDLPSRPGQASDRATGSVDRTPKPGETTEAADTDADAGTGTEGPTESSETESPESPETEAAGETEAATESATPTPNFRGLCTAFQATDRSEHGKSLDSAAFTALAAAAGSADQVAIATYCVGLIGEPKESGKPTELPTPTSKPTQTGQPTGKPTGKPSVLPTPTDKPRPDRPTDKPDQSGKGGGKDSTTSGS